MVEQTVQPASGESVRMERDSMGEVAVPAWAKYRAQTQRAVDNFPVSFRAIDRELIGAIASVGANWTQIGVFGLAEANAARPE